MGIRKPKTDIARLYDAVRGSRYALQRWRKERMEATRLYVGNHWSDDGYAEQQPLNLIAQYVRIVGRGLVSKCPKFSMQVVNKEFKPTVAAMQSWTNRQLMKMGFQETMHRAVFDALFSIGIVKVGLAMPVDAELSNKRIIAGEAFADVVDLDDFVYDIHATRMRDAAFVGHRIRVPLEFVKDSTLYGKERKELSADGDELFNPDGDERIDSIGKGAVGKGIMEFRDMVTLWEIYLPSTKRLVTLAGDGDSAGAVLRDVEWVGPPGGPYHFLGFDPVPGNAMPKAPIQDLVDLHTAYNELYRKLIRQAKRQKQVWPFSSGDSDGLQAFKIAPDGEAFQCQNPADFKSIDTGGANQQNFGFATHLKDLFAWGAGGIDIMGGLRPMSRTASQDKMLNENSSRQLTDMQSIVEMYAEGVGRSLAWYWWNDPERVMETTYTIPDSKGLTVERVIGPEDRLRVPFDYLDIGIVPYTLKGSSPQEMANKLKGVVTQLVMPMLPLVEKQGIAIDISALLAKIAEYEDIPDLAEVMQIQDPPIERGGSAATRGPGMANNTTRNYVRESVSGEADPTAEALDIAGIDQGGDPNG